MPRRFTTAVVLMAVSCSAAAAAPATPEEAKRLTALFQTYVGTPGADGTPSVTVAPEGESYRATFDITRLASPLKAFGIDLVATGPYVATLTPLNDGTWRVERGAFPSFGLTTTKGFTYSVDYLSAGSTAIFDPKIEAFVQEKTALSGTRTSITDGHFTQQTEVLQQGNLTGQSSGPSAHEVSTSLHEKVEGARYHSHRESAKNATGSVAGFRAPSTTDATIGSVVADISIAHQNVAALLDLWAFLVAHPSRDQLVAAQPELKRLASAMIPYASGVALATNAHAIETKMDGGSARVGAFEEKLSFGGEKAPEAFALDLKVDDVAIAMKTALPNWVAAALPKSVGLHLVTSRLAPAGTLRALVDAADLKRDDILPPDAMSRAIAKLSADEPTALEMKPSTVTNGTLTLDISGRYSLSGVGAAQITAKGLEDEIALIGKSAADDFMAAQAVQVLSMAKALARPASDGRLTWAIEIKPSSLTVNGQPLR